MRILSLSILVALAASSAPEQSLMERGVAYLQPLKLQLQSELKAGMAKGVGAAIEVCRVRAPEIAADLQTDAVEMGRTSHRLRNPVNEMRPWIEPLLAGYLADPENARLQLVRLAGGRIGYLEPIVTQPLCLVCHGSKLAQPVREKIEELYPSDYATGFATGDIRGVFWVEMSERATP